MTETDIEKSAPILDVHDLTMRFGGVTALQGIRHAVPRNIIQAVIGPNGAGMLPLPASPRRLGCSNLRREGSALRAGQ